MKTFQVHRHSETCRRYRNDKCRFNFVKCFTDRTIVAEPLPDDMPEEIKIRYLRIVVIYQVKLKDILIQK